MGKRYSDKVFQVNDRITIVCHAERTRSGFRHLATLLVNGFAQAMVKECYLNRTWEAWEFQTVVRKLANKVKFLPNPDQRAIRDYIDNYRGDSAGLRAVAMVAALGSVLCPSQDAANDWKLRMIKAGLPGIEPPDDWDQLDEAEKARRLDLVIAELGG